MSQEGTTRSEKVSEKYDSFLICCALAPYLRHSRQKSRNQSQVALHTYRAYDSSDFRVNYESTIKCPRLMSTPLQSSTHGLCAELQASQVWRCCLTISRVCRLLREGQLLH